MATQRPRALTIATGLLVLFSLLNLMSALVPAFTDGVPPLVVYVSVALGVVGLVAAYGLWALKRWSVWLTVILSVLNILAAAPGIAFAPTIVLFVAATATVVGYALLIVLVMLPASRRAHA